jgi:hypothetical protein
MTIAERDLWDALPMPGVYFDECAGMTGTYAVDGLRAALSCPRITSAIDQPIEYLKFADAASMDAYLQTAADRSPISGSAVRATRKTGSGTSAPVPRSDGGSVRRSGP